jgi:transposase
MTDCSEVYVGIDTSKLRNAVSLAEGGRNGEVRYLGEIANTEAATIKLVKKLAAKYDRVSFCYEAGPTGYGVRRQVTALGSECIVAAPSLIPKKPGDRVKTNRRDAVSLAKLFRAGELTAVWVPDRRHEAMRECSLVVARYGVEGGPSGVVAVLGPTRMHYARTIPKVRYLAQLLGDLIAHI